MLPLSSLSNNNRIPAAANSQQRQKNTEKNGTSSKTG